MPRSDVRITGALRLIASSTVKILLFQRLLEGESKLRSNVGWKMGFSEESELQELIHRQPQVLQDGIPDISPRLSSQAGRWVALGREAKIDGYYADNLFVDINGIVTIVECKRYGDSRLKRDVYAQTMNYASGLRAEFQSCPDESFTDEFFELISSGGSEYCDWGSFDELVEELRSDEILENNKTSLWEQQFRRRLHRNLRRGIFRIIILCAPPRSAQSFKADAVSNLMEMMSYSERENSPYELLLMDIRRSHDAPPSENPVEHTDYRSRIIWRRHTSLPEVPLVRDAKRDTTEGINKMNERREAVEENNEVARKRLEAFSENLKERGYTFKETTVGEKIYRDSSLYMHLEYDPEHADWQLVRVQVREREELFDYCHNGTLQEKLEEQFGWTGEVESERKDSSDTFQITLRPDYSVPIDPELVGFLSK